MLLSRSPRVPLKQLAFELVPPPAPTLENFVSGANGELLERLRTLGASPASERSVYIWGPPGSGRTHLLRATVDHLQSRGMRAAYAIDVADVPMELNAVAVDDVDALDETAAAALFTLYNSLRENGGIVIAAGAEPPARLTLRADVVTRLAWGLVYELRPLTDAEKAHALAEHAAGRGFTVAPEVVRYLLAHAPRDMGSLIATVDALDRYSMETKRPATVPLLRELLESDG
jgi:DnaA family protein